MHDARAAGWLGAEVACLGLVSNLWYCLHRVLLGDPVDHGSEVVHEKLLHTATGWVSLQGQVTSYSKVSWGQVLELDHKGPLR